MIYIRELSRKLYLLPLFCLILLAVTRIWIPQPLIAVPPATGLCNYFEPIIPFLLLLPISFLLPDKYEIELGLVCGISTRKLMFSKLLPLLIYILINTCTIITLIPFTGTGYSFQQNQIIPIYIPANYKIYLFASALITVSFFVALFLFLRVTTKNCYTPVGAGLMIYILYYNQNNNIRNGHSNIRTALFDPFISNYIISDEIPSKYYSIGNIWTYNRLLFLGLAVVMLAVTYVLLRREKLHQEFHD